MAVEAVSKKNAQKGFDFKGIVKYVVRIYKRKLHIKNHIDWIKNYIGYLQGGPKKVYDVN